MDLQFPSSDYFNPFRAKLEFAYSISKAKNNHLPMIDLYLFSMTTFSSPPPISKTFSFATSCLPHSQTFSRASVACASNAEHTVSLLSHRIAVPPTRITEFLRVVKRDELSSRRRNAIIEFKK